MYPLVTIGMPTYNRAKFIKKSVESILSQSFSNFELIIYDDGSTDNTLDILSSLKEFSSCCLSCVLALIWSWGGISSL